ncbi:MFS transporter [Fusibacter sp. 3D3]|uniref:MFS transporter n=1 Tax=Fusibacter sp. 3D3 TaxID=1048380 RepID=UPI0008531739|nr:MFS transporter [Fusibacter sp. 3D3]GAU77603.1 permease of the major facilitator superfamily [Fusibacter sp. 3D3]
MFQFFNEYKGLPREVYVLFIANVINRFGDFVSPLLALYLTQKLSMSVTESSIVVTLALVSRMPGSLMGGKLADHYGRRKIYLIMQTIAGLTLFPCAFISTPHVIIILLITSTFFNGAVRPALDALAIDLMPVEKRKLGLSLMYLGINIGVAVGPALAGLLFKINLPLFFMIDVLTSLIAVMLVFTFISEHYIKTMISSHVDPETLWVKSNATTASILKSNKRLATFILITSAFSLIYVQVKFSLPLLFAYAFNDNGSALLGTIFSINAFTVILSTSFITLKTKNNATSVNIILGGIFYAVGFGLYAIISGYLFYVLATITWTFGEILMATNIKTYIADHTPTDFRGRINALYLILKEGMNALGVLLSGWLIPIIGPIQIWWFVLGASLFLSLLIFLDNRKEL